MSTAAVGAKPAVAAPARSAALIGCLELSRPRIAVLVLVVVAISGLVAGWGVLDPLAVVHATLGTLLVAASASAFNQVMEAETDRLMDRTAPRPLPSGRMSPAAAMVFGTICGFVGVVYLAVFAGWQPAVWAAVSWALYVMAYTPLKSRSPVNTLIGAVSGALPVWIGWTAVRPLSQPWSEIRPLSLFLVVFLWQFPHFMAIAWLYRRQYGRAGLKMLSVVDPSGRHAGLQAILAAAWLIPVSLVLGWGIPTAGATWFTLAALTLGVVQLGFAAWFCQTRSDLAARYLLRCSLVYLPALLMFLVWIPWI